LGEKKIPGLKDRRECRCVICSAQTMKLRQLKNYDTGRSVNDALWLPGEKENFIRGAETGQTLSKEREGVSRSHERIAGDRCARERALS